MNVLTNEPTTPQPKWYCIAPSDVPNQFLPAQLNADGDAQCMAKDGRNCLWASSKAECENIVATNRANELHPLACGAAHAKFHNNSTGYDHPGHWCNVGQKLPGVTRWVCVTPTDNASGQYVAVQRNINDDIQCMASDGINCIWSTSKAECEALVASKHKDVALQPLACGAQHAKANQNKTGYDHPGHWCNVGRMALGPKWTCVKPTDNANFVPVHRNAKGDIQCMATNGKDCLWSSSLGECEMTVKKNEGNLLQPLACGDQHMAEKGSTGYDHPGHWCDVGQKTV